MKVCAIVNREAGTLRSLDAGAFADRLRGTFEDRGHQVAITLVDGAGVADALDDASGESTCDVILAAGGDGTISTAASVCMKSGKTLGVLPAGTMNLFARTLNIPLEPDRAAAALASGQKSRVDMAFANGRPVLHQYSVGLQPHLVRERKQIGYNSRMGKILSGIRSAFRISRRLPVFPVEIIREGASTRRRLSIIAISNNLHGEGHIPYPDDLAGNVLGIYTAPELSARDGLKLIADLVTGTWSANPHLEISSARSLVLRFPDHAHQVGSLIDGEMCPVEAEVSFESRAGALSVLVPAKTA